MRPLSRIAMLTATLVTLVILVALVTPIDTAVPRVAAQGAVPAPVATASPTLERIDAVFSRWTNETPGCAVGVGAPGRASQMRAYGMADLEHGVRNTPDTIFEAGSVTKQFTAAAVLLLVQDGKVALDDQVRKYFPEIPDYGASLTIRHLLTHTSGLRDWGTLEGIAGWPRGTRVYTHAHVLEILSRQRALNFTPGTRWSYSNSGYNLAAMLIERVSGQSFAGFTRTRLFAPLGLAATSWRDDYARIVPRRAVAYSAAPANTYRQDMPFENAVGNGGLLTTVGDLLTWNRAFAQHMVPIDTTLTVLQQTAARLPDGRALDYAFGLFLRSYKGLAEVQHSGATAGYRTFLTRVPTEGHLSVAVLCNAADANPTASAHAVADLYLGDRLRPGAQAAPTLPEAQGPTPVARDPDYRVSAADLAGYTGTYVSDEIETPLIVELRGDALVVRRRPNTTIALLPLVRDAFSGGSLGTVRFHRSGGTVTELGVTQDRVWDLRFAKR
jgi:CubicO group peptidase (beta-lactamase class C family)